MIKKKIFQVHKARASFMITAERDIQEQGRKPVLEIPSKNTIFSIQQISCSNKGTKKLYTL